MNAKVVAIVGTLDTKGVEYAFLKARIEAHGVATLVIDAGVLGAPPFPPDIAAAEVAGAGGADLAALRAPERPRRGDGGDGARAPRRSPRGSTREGRIDGVVAMGGGGGTTIGTAAMRALPVGVPKLMLSTLASGDVRAYVGVKDITMMPSVVDIAGINRLVVAHPRQRRRRHRRHGQAPSRRRPSPRTGRSSPPPCSASPRPASPRRARCSRRPATRCWSSTPPAPAGRPWRR